jgi:choloylglycine hydrolase
MGFPIELQWGLSIVPRGQKMTSAAPGGAPGVSWTGKYGLVGIDVQGQRQYCDGLNEKGLSVGTLWLDPGTEYPKPASAERALSILDAPLWMLSNFATVPEVKEGLKSVTIWGEVAKALGFVPPVHLALHDALGNNLVVEFVKGETNVYDNPNSVLTNEPTFDWQLTNLDVLKANKDLSVMPGGTSAAARFAQLSHLRETLPQPKSSDEAIRFAIYLLDRVSDVPGEVAWDDPAHASAMPYASQYAEWSVVRDHKNLVFYYRTHANNSWRGIDLKKANLDAGQPIKSLGMDSDGVAWYQDTTNKAQ